MTKTTSKPPIKSLILKEISGWELIDFFKYIKIDSEGKEYQPLSKPKEKPVSISNNLGSKGFEYLYHSRITPSYEIQMPPEWMDKYHLDQVPKLLDYSDYIHKFPLFLVNERRHMMEEQEESEIERLIHATELHILDKYSANLSRWALGFLKTSINEHEQNYPCESVLEVIQEPHVDKPYKLTIGEKLLKWLDLHRKTFQPLKSSDLPFLKYQESILEFLKNISSNYF